ncbi:MAG: IS1096 element passenger TnpR family protein [Candidatus Natronoplasma sp.]
MKAYKIKVWTINDPFDTIDEEASRVLLVPPSKDLYSLAEAVNESFDFYFDHPFGFYDDPDPFRAEEGYELFADMGEESEYEGVKDIEVKDVYTEIGKRMLYYFDYGDGWRFGTELLDEQESGKTQITVLESEGEAPEQYPSLER